MISDYAEAEFWKTFNRTCHDSSYPFHVFSGEKNLEEVSFSDITIFCGSNGSGKSTLLNIIAEKLNLRRESRYNKTYFFDPYVKGCNYEMNTHDKVWIKEIMEVSRIITSDDVFDHIIDVRRKNDNLGFKREVAFEGGFMPKVKPKRIDFNDQESVDAFFEYQTLSKMSTSQYVRQRIGIEERTYSNGENGYKYFTDAIQPGGLYLLDEPENSLSAELQKELVGYLVGMARYNECQFILSTHSPFILSIPGAKIYDMDATPVKPRKWTQLENVRTYYDFFKSHEHEFKEEENEEQSEKDVDVLEDRNDIHESSDLMQKDINTLREGFACYCKLLGIDQKTCFALILLMETKELLLALMKFMAEIEQRGIKEGVEESTTTIVCRVAEKLRLAYDAKKEQSEKKGKEQWEEKLGRRN